MSESSFSRDAAERLVRARVEERLEEEYEAKRKPAPVLTVSRQLGSRGTALAREVGKRLGWSVWDREIVDKIAEDAGLRRELVEGLDERIRGDLQSAMSEVFGRQILDSMTYKRRLVEAILSLSQGGRCIFVGRGASFVVRQGVHVRVCAPYDVRLRNVMQDQELDEREARKRIDGVERERARFMRRHFRCENLDDPLLYDLVINTSRCRVDAAAEVVIACLLQRFDLQAA